jgi:hypothetical protein
VVRTRELPGHYGRYLYGDFCDGWVASALMGPRARDARMEGLTVPYLASFGEDARGRLYATSTLGTLYAVRARAK